MHNYSKAEYIASSVRVLSVPFFRRHVRRRSGLSEDVWRSFSFVDGYRLDWLGRRWLRTQERDAEIDELHPAISFPDHYVLGLYILMNNASAMCDCKSFCDLDGNSSRSFLLDEASCYPVSY